MTTTPETDAKIIVTAKFARKLERERNDARELAERLYNALLCVGVHEEKLDVESCYEEAKKGWQ